MAGERQKRIIFDNGITVARWCTSAGGGRAVVITFDPMMAVDVSRPGFGQDFLLANGYDVICFQKRKENWYQDVSVEEFAAALAGPLASYGSVFTYGSSMGAYAALYFAEAAGATALAFSPRHPAYYRHAGMPSYKNEFKLTHPPLSARTPSGTRHVVMFDPGNAIDGPYFLSEVTPAFPQSTIVRFPYSAHPTIYCFHEGRLLKDVVLGFLGGQRDFTAVRRTARRRSATCLSNLADACLKRGHVRWAESVRRMVNQPAIGAPIPERMAQPAEP